MGFSYSTDNATSNGIVSAAGRPYFHDAHDAQRSMAGRTPEAMYPDGYLGTINSRRGDRILDAVKNVAGKRNYQRGVHKGERIDPGDYHWIPEWNPMTGLQNEAMGMKTTPAGDQFVRPHLTKGGKMPQPIDSPTTLDPHRISQLSRLAPTWR